MNMIYTSALALLSPENNSSWYFKTRFREAYLCFSEDISAKSKEQVTCRVAS